MFFAHVPLFYFTLVRFALVAEGGLVKLTLRLLIKGGDNGFVHFRYPHAQTRLSAGF
ncbi:MAG: hypothetical protein LAN62_04470 [Acidobacteriia bacterium]|nr:hypothetical protein [Terriglobia bacterium]